MLTDAGVCWRILTYADVCWQVWTQSMRKVLWGHLHAQLDGFEMELSLNPTAIWRVMHTSPYVSIRQHTSTHVSIRQHTSAYVSIRQHTSAYVSIRQYTSLPKPNSYLAGNVALIEQ